MRISAPLRLWYDKAARSKAGTWRKTSERPSGWASYLGGRLVGVGAVKRLGAHHNTIVRCSGFKNLASFSAEIGYFYLDPSCRGKGFAGKLFSYCCQGPRTQCTRRPERITRQCSTFSRKTASHVSVAAGIRDNVRERRFTSGSCPRERHPPQWRCRGTCHLSKLIQVVFSWQEDYPPLSRSCAGPNSLLSRYRSRFDSRCGTGCGGPEGTAASRGGPRAFPRG